MKNQMFNLIKVVTLAAILAVGVSAVSAFTGPATLTPPNGPETSVPADVSSTPQNKVGGFISALFLKAGIAHPFALSGAAAAGWVIAEDKIISPWSFSEKTFLPGDKSQMKIGSATDSSDPFTDATFPLTIDLSGRGTAPDSKGRDAIEFLADPNFCNTKTTVVTNTPGIQFWSTKNGSTGDNADLVARQVQLNGGNPAKDKVLISTDAAGNATWAKVKVTNGVISYTDYTTSPAAIGQSICDNAPQPVYHWEVAWKGCRYVDDSVIPVRQAEDGTATCRNSSNQRVNETNCASLPAPVLTRPANSSLPLCNVVPPVDPPQSDPVKSWYCHIGGGSWVNEGQTVNCHGEYNPSGYAFPDTTRVCSTVKPPDANCVGPQNTSPFPKWSDVKHQQFVCDISSGIGYYQGSSCR